MEEERKKILQMLSDGKITVEDAHKLLEATSTSEKQVEKKENSISLNDKFFYVKVEPKEGKSSERVSVKVPFALLKAGLNIAGLIPKEAQDKINSTMNKNGMSFDFSDLKPENVKELMGSLELLTVDVETDEATVKVYCK